MTRITRSTLLRRALAGAAMFVLPGRALAGAERGAALSRLAVRNASRRYHGDRTLFATVSPGVPGRDTAVVSLELARRAHVSVEAVRTALRTTSVAWQDTRDLGPGAHELDWTPDPTTPPGSYVMRVTVDGEREGSIVVGARRPASISVQKAPVVRVLGVEAAFALRSYAPGERARLTIFADSARLSLQFLRCGTEAEVTTRNDEMRGTRLGDAATLDWSGKRSAPAAIDVDLGLWPTGLYAARLDTEDGRVGFAPFVVRPATPGSTRVAAIAPTNTWQAYNFYDRDGDGWGDTWYAGGTPPVELGRPYRDRGTPPRFRRYDLPFLKWLTWSKLAAELLADDDLESLPTGDELRRLYDLVVFPGHSEYMTAHAYDVVQRFRDLGGRLIFLSSNNFFWRVDREGDTIRRVKRWRDLGRPEAALIGTQYRGNDDGSRRGAFVVTDPSLAPWLFEGTGLSAGSRIGEGVGGFGIEIDATTRDSPPGTAVLAQIPDIYGPGYTAQMTYYETPAGSRVFSAGALDFASSATNWPVRRMLANLWQHMLTDVPQFPPTAPPPDEAPPSP
jgi:hypothetical protein